MTNTVLAPPQWALARHSGFYTLQYFTMSRIDISSSDNSKTAVCYTLDMHCVGNVIVLKTLLILWRGSVGAFLDLLIDRIEVADAIVDSSASLVVSNALGARGNQ